MSQRAISLPDSRPADRFPVASWLRALAFWSAVLLPGAYLPLLLGGEGFAAFLGLLTLNVVCLIAGHDYAR